MIVEELLAKLGFEFDDKDLQKFEKGIGNATKILAGAAAVATAYAGAMFKLTENVAENNDKIGKQAQMLGISAEELQSLTYAAEIGGASAGEMASSLENLSKTASQAARGIGGGVETFAMLGISVTDANGRIKDSSTLMMELSDRISRMKDTSQKIEFLNNLGVSSNLLLTLNQGMAELNRQKREAKELGYFLTQKDVQNAADFNDSLLRVGKVVDGLNNMITAKAMPAITEMMESFTQWYKNNKKLIEQNVTEFVDKLSSALRATWRIAKRVWSVVNSLAKAMGGWKIVILSLGAAFMALNARALMIPLLVAAIGVALFLLVEDLQKYYDKQDSWFGDMAKKHKWVAISLEALRQILKQVSDGWELVFTSGDKAFDGFIIYVKSIGKHIIDFMITPLNQVLGLIDKIAGTDFTIKNPLADTYDAVGEDFKSMFESIKDYIIPNDSGGFATPNSYITTPAQAAAISTRNSMTSSATFEANITVNSNGGDGKQIAQSIKGQMDSWFRDLNKKTLNNLKTGVER